MNADPTFSIDVAPDRDTRGLSGSPAIADAIMAKINNSDAFVCDVSIINGDTKGRPTPNPNVLLELGYAIARLGWHRIVLVANTASGPITNLPFDVHGRRVVSYSLNADECGKAEARAIVVKQLEAALRHTLAPLATRPAGRPDGAIWWGRWSTPTKFTGAGASLHIREVGEFGFFFVLSVFSGTHTGQTCGVARFVGPDSAMAWLDGEPGLPCQLAFERDRAAGTITMTESEGCRHHHGAGVRFDWVVHRDVSPLYDIGGLDDLDLARLYALMGHHLWAMEECMQLVGPDEDLDQFGATVTCGFVRGAANSMAGIVMRGEEGELWVAFTNGDSVHYFTTQAEHAHSLPKTIESWRESFADLPIKYGVRGDIIEGLMH